ncbi:MAG: flagellar hook-associated protein FlgL [Burkholderiaceae bacterium]
MRISTNTLYESGLARMTESQASLLKTQQQISTGKRILTPADDPVGAARVLNLTQGQELNAQYAVNRQNAKNSLSLEESVLQQTTELIQDVKTLVIQAGNPSYDATQLSFIAVELQTHFDELMSIANTRDGMGNYLFSGYQLNTKPYMPSIYGAQFNGDQGRTMMQVESARQMAIGDSGDQIFDNIPSSGTFIADVTSGSSTVSRVSVVDAQQMPPPPGKEYDIEIFDNGGVLSYRVFDISQTPRVPVKTATPLSSGIIEFDGMQLTSTNAIAGDVITVRPNDKQSLFTTLQDLITLLQTQGSGVVGRANLQHGLDIANTNFSAALDNVLSVRASVGSRLKELDNLDEMGDARNEQYETQISNIEDVDYNRALSDLSKNQIILEAAQKSFAKITGLSLFNLL